jgi:carbon-monoxide dehydrogenase large subunit
VQSDQSSIINHQSSILFREQLPLLRGQGRYVDDLNPPNTVHVAFVRSPYAHAGVRSLDTEAAIRRPGVLAVLSGAELRSRIKPVRARLQAPAYHETDWYPLAWDKVRYVGEAVVAVVAEDRYRAEDAAGRVQVDYEPLPALTSTTQALTPDAPRVHEHLSDNVLFHTQLGSDEGKGAFENAEVRVRGTFRHPRVTGLAIENCGVLAEYRRETDELVVWSSNQVPHLLRDVLSECLGQPAHRLRVIAPDVGGAFGIKMHALPEELVVAYLARELGRPVKWTQDRLENLQASIHARDTVVEAELAACRDGTLVGIRATAICDVGAYSAFPVTCALEPYTIASTLAGPYRFTHFAYDGYAVATNKCPVGAYRGVGFVLGPLVIEGLLDQLARKLDMDPAELRAKNMAGPDEFPFQSPSGAVYDSGNYPRLLDMALNEAGYTAWRAEQETARGEGRLLGIGLACFVEPTGMGRGTYRRRGMLQMPAFDSATLRIDRKGHLEAYVSTPSQGQSQQTTFAQMLSQALGIPLETIQVYLGDTATCPYGSGTFASRSIVSGGGAILQATEKLRERLVRLAAAHWGTHPSQVWYANGTARLQDGSGKRLTWAELAEIAYSPLQDLPPDVEPGLEVHCAYDPPPAAWSAGVHLARVEIDPQTGKVAVRDYVVAEDCGCIVNQQVVDGQIRGGVAQGAGIALWEELVYDEQGQLLTGSLLDYLAPGAYELPDIRIVHLETPSPWTEGGHKGVAESGTIGAPAAIANAVLDALGASAGEVRLPLTPERVLGLREDAPSPDPSPSEHGSKGDKVRGTQRVPEGAGEEGRFAKRPSLSPCLQVSLSPLLPDSPAPPLLGTDGGGEPSSPLSQIGERGVRGVRAGP